MSREIFLRNSETIVKLGFGDIVRIVDNSYHKKLYSPTASLPSHHSPNRFVVIHTGQIDEALSNDGFRLADDPETYLNDTIIFHEETKAVIATQARFLRPFILNKVT